VYSVLFCFFLISNFENFFVGEVAGKIKKKSSLFSFSNIAGSTMTRGELMVNNKLEWIWKEAFVVFFKLLNPCLLGKGPNLACDLVEILDRFTSQIQIRNFSSHAFFNNVEYLGIKVNLNLSLCLIKCHFVKTHGVMEVQIHAFLTAALD